MIDINDDRGRLDEIQDEIFILLAEARQLLDCTEYAGIWARAKAYWWAQMRMAVNNTHGFLGSASVSMEDTALEMAEMAGEMEREKKGKEDQEG